MTREQFCNNLLEHRKTSGVKMRDICFAMNVMPTAIYRLENGKNNFSMDKAIGYLSAINHRIYLIKEKIEFEIIKYEDIVRWVIQARLKIHTQRELATKIECTNATIANTELGKSIVSVDIFLRLVEALGYSINIQYGK